MNFNREMVKTDCNYTKIHHKKAVYIDGKWVPKCFKNSCAIGRTKCCPTYNQGLARLAKQLEDFDLGLFSRRNCEGE